MPDLRYLVVGEPRRWDTIDSYNSIAYANAGVCGSKVETHALIPLPLMAAQLAGVN